MTQQVRSTIIAVVVMGVVALIFKHEGDVDKATGNASANELKLEAKVRELTVEIRNKDQQLTTKDGELVALQRLISNNDKGTSCEPAFPSYQQWLKHYTLQLNMARTHNQLALKEPEKFMLNTYVQSLAAKVRGDSVMYPPDCTNCRPEWPHFGETMVWKGCLNCLHDIIRDVSERKISGHFLEAGVWRGGASIFSRKLVELYGMQDRTTFVCDSFQGLPTPRHPDKEPEDNVYNPIGYLSVPLEDVKSNFRAYCLLSDKVLFYKGFFVDSLPTVRQYLLENKMKLAVLRADGDMYDSTIDILYNLYDLVEVGGYIIIDDFGWTKWEWKARDAIMDFRRNHGIEDKEHRFVNCGGKSAYYRKARDVPLQRERYPDTARERELNRHKVYPEKRITQQEYDVLRTQWEGWMKDDPLIK